ncbi:MAG: efflux RND transporter periplasmic adaptor subunit [Prevotella sp.]|nr:efflux RND transporter periplasmic adaptor subunit [Prevotella sp.]MBQ9570185.1 efflux RND transporter periplasmic adaptor subunit [Prevotella sp.]
MKKGILAFITLLLICGCGDKKEQKQKAPIRVNTEILGTENVDRLRQYVGTVEENEGTAVSFTGMGVVRQVLVDEGQAVKRGQLIAVMDDTQARNVLSGAEAQMAQANDALSRYKMLHDNGSLTEVQWVEIQSKVAQAQSQLEVAKKNLSDCRLTAPVSGIIGRKQISAGETALPSQAVVTILDINTVKVKVSIPETEMGRIHAHTPSVIKVDATDRSYQGGRIEKGVQADALTHTYDIRINVVNHDRKLLPGMVANVQLGTGETVKGESNSLMLPVTAVQKRSNGELFVWTIDDKNTAHRTTVTIGHTAGNRVSILSGVKAGERVVTDGYQKLSEGTKVVF